MTQMTQLLVPIELKALLVNQPVLNGTSFRRWQNNYRNLTDYMQNPMPAPFQDKGDAAKQGFHLQWRVPQALRHGQPGSVLFVVMADVADIVADLDKQQISDALRAAFTAQNYPLSASGASVLNTGSGDNAGWTIKDWDKQREFALGVDVDTQGNSFLRVSDAHISFPLVPNRWLLCRFQHGTPGAPPDCWMIESDYMNATDGSVSFLDPNQDNISDLKVATRIGRSREFTTTWTEPDAQGHMFLRAIGPGDETFSAYAPSAEAVFSFVDTGAAQLQENTALSYAIFGWYANPAFDPLHNPIPEVADKKFLAVMGDLNWSIAGVDDLAKYTGPIADRSVCHGMVHGLTWQTAMQPSGSATEVPGDIGKSVKVAIGNTSVEALSALIENTSGEQDVDITMLEALQYGVLEALDTVGGTTLVADRARAAHYSAATNGVDWAIGFREMDQGSELIDQEAVLAAYAEALAKLNVLQRQTDQDMQQLQSLQWTLYARWWKYQYEGVLGLTPSYPPENWEDVQKDLDPSSEAYTKLVGDIRALLRKIAAAYAGGSLPIYSDQASIDDYAANVLKLPPELKLKASGAPRSWYPNEPVLVVSGVANPADMSSGDALQCRTAGQMVTGLTVGGTTVTTADAASVTPLPPQNADIPQVVYDLSKELYFLDPANWDYLSANLFHGKASPAEIATAIQAGSWAQPGEFGPVPAAVQSWVQPWAPLFLEWSVRWYATYSQKDSNSPWVFDRDAWSFDGDDYQWTGTRLDPSIVVGYTGRSVLSSHSVLNFENRLKAYIESSHSQDDKLERLEKLIETMKSWGILSQRLSGLQEEFATRSIDPSWPPFDDVAELIQNEFRAAPDPTKGDLDVDYGPAPPTFFPQMGGFFVFDNIEIVDAFGQTISLLAANNNPAGGGAKNFVPIRSRQVTPANPNISVGDYTPAQFVQQAFGLVQPASLDLRWVDAVHDDEEVGCAAAANPVCGWILPNHLDNALSFYDQGGALLGEVAENLQTSEVEWLPAPDAAKPIVDPGDIPNLHLRGLVTGLIAAQHAAPGSIENFMNVIDETLWLVDPLGGRGDQNLSVLIGRPLAVLRLQVGFSLRGSPYDNQSWATTLTADDNGITRTPLQLRLGSLNLRHDGLIGYFAEEKFNVFNSVHFPSGLVKGTKYVRQIGGSDGNYLSLVPDAKGAYLTLLMDPRGSLHGASGILPVKEITLPRRFVDGPLKSMEVTFRVGSLLSSTAAIQIPRLVEQNGTWSWVYHTSPSEYRADPIVFTSPNANLSAPATEIVDGWLRLVANLEKDEL